jgi:hypothetical protein
VARWNPDEGTERAIGKGQTGVRPRGQTGSDFVFGFESRRAFVLAISGECHEDCGSNLNVPSTPRHQRCCPDQSPDRRKNKKQILTPTRRPWSQIPGLTSSVVGL